MSVHMKGCVLFAAGMALITADARADCPATVPDAGSMCDGAATCEYGGDAHGLCATFALCNGGAWHVYAPDAGCGAPRADCPASFAALDAGASCPMSDPNALCVYPEGACSCPKPCRTADGGLGSEWICRAWSSSWPGCPSARPPLGAACDQDGALCAWDGCCWDVPFGPDEQCVDGQWALHPLDLCACSGDIESCPSPADAGVPVAPPIGDRESSSPVASGCDCGFGGSGGVSAIAPVAVALALARRRLRSSGK